MRSMSTIPLPPAPGSDVYVSLALADSVVSLPGEHRADELVDPIAATRWLVDHGLVPTGTALLEYCQQRLTVLRGHLRELFAAAVEGRAPEADAVDALNSALRQAPSAEMLEYTPELGFHRGAAHPLTQLVEHALARISEDAVALLAGEDASLLDTCQAPSCDRFFVRTHARRRWCSTRCGDRVRAARAYEKKRAAAS